MEILINRALRALNNNSDRITTPRTILFAFVSETLVQDITHNVPGFSMCHKSTLIARRGARELEYLLD